MIDFDLAQLGGSFATARVNVGTSILFAIVNALVAHGKGRSAIIWGLLGFFLPCFSTLLLVFMSDLSESDEDEDSDARIEKLETQTRRLREQLRKERTVNESFRSRTLGRLDAHDIATNLDTRDITAPLDLPAADALPGEVPVWYYEDGGHPSGPVSRNALLALRAAGNVNPATLVWRDGFHDWVPFIEVNELSPRLSQ